MLSRKIFSGLGIVLVVVGLGLAPFIYMQTGKLSLAVYGLIPVGIGIVYTVIAWVLARLEDMFNLDGGSRLSPSARLGTGTVLSVARTGMTVNDVPRYRISLRVRDADMSEFTGELKMLVPHHELDAVRPGALLPVIYEPSDPTRLYLVPEDRIAEAQQVLQRQQVQLGLADPRAAEVYDRGVPVTGVVMSMTPTGEIRHGQTGLETVLRFTNPHGVMVERSKRMFLPSSSLELVGVGRQVNLRVLPEDDTQLALELPARG
jgi:hypothetical protein